MKIGNKVRTQVNVCGQWRPMTLGIVTKIISDTLVEIDVGSLHGCSPWLRIEQISHLRLEENGQENT